MQRLTRYPIKHASSILFSSWKQFISRKLGRSQLQNLSKLSASYTQTSQISNIATAPNDLPKTNLSNETPAKTGGFNKICSLSEPLAELLGETNLSRPQVVKRIWAYIKDQNLQDPKDKRYILCDDRMRLVFKSGGGLSLSLKASGETHEPSCINVMDTQAQNDKDGQHAKNWRDGQNSKDGQSRKNEDTVKIGEGSPSVRIKRSKFSCM